LHVERWEIQSWMFKSFCSLLSTSMNDVIVLVVMLNLKKNPYSVMNPYLHARNPG
jgi:hypothetical protein